MYGWNDGVGGIREGNRKEIRAKKHVLREGVENGIDRCADIPGTEACDDRRRKGPRVTMNAVETASRVPK